MRMWWKRKVKTMILWMTQSHQFHKHVTDAKKKGCNSDEKEAQARSTTIPHPRTATKRRQRTTEKVDLNLTFHFNYNSIRANYIPDKDDNIVCEDWPKIDPHESCDCRATIPRPLTATKICQRTMENVDLNPTLHASCVCRTTVQQQCHVMSLSWARSSCVFLHCKLFLWGLIRFFS